MVRTRLWTTSNSNSAFRAQRSRTSPMTGGRNLIRFSELQSSTLWTGYSANKKTTNGGFSSTIADPTGTFTMNEFTPTGANKGMYQVFTAGGTTPTAGLRFTVSAWLASTLPVEGGFAYYDGADGTPVTFLLSSTPKRYSATFTLRNSPAPESASNVTVMGVTANIPILWWGYQLELGSTMTQYKKTS